MSITTRILPLAILVTVWISGCKVITRNMSEGAVEGVKKEQIDEYLEKTVDRIIENAKADLLGVDTRERVDSLLNVINQRINTGIDTMTVTARNNLLSEYTTLRIKQMILEAGDAANSSAGKIMGETVGPQAKKLVADIRDELLGDSTLRAVANIRTELLGAKTEQLVDSLILSSMKTLSTSFKKDLKPEIIDALKQTNDEVKSTVGYAAWVFGIMAAILLIICAVLFRKFSLRSRVTKILTEEVDKIRDQDIYDEVVQKVSERTKQANVHQELNSILKTQNLYQQPEWVEKDKQLLRTMVSELGDNLELKAKLEAKNLKEHFESIKKRQV